MYDEDLIGKEVEGPRMVTEVAWMGVLRILVNKYLESTPNS